MRAPRSARAAARGMTLIEIMVVVAIMGMLATLVTVYVIGQQEEAKVDGTKIQMRTLVEALEMYKAQRGLSTWTDVAHRLGLSEAGLQTMLGAPAAQGDDTAPDSDPLSQAAAATRLLEHALSRVRLGQGNDRDVAQLLDQLGAYVMAHRARLERARSKAQVEDKIRRQFSEEEKSGPRK